MEVGVGRVGRVGRWQPQLQWIQSCARPCACLVLARWRSSPCGAIATGRHLEPTDSCWHKHWRRPRMCTARGSLRRFGCANVKSWIGREGFVLAWRCVNKNLQGPTLCQMRTIPLTARAAWSWRSSSQCPKSMVVFHGWSFWWLFSHVFPGFSLESHTSWYFVKVLRMGSLILIGLFGPPTRRECADINAASMPSPMSEATPKLPPEQQLFAIEYIECNLSAKLQFVHSDVPYTSLQLTCRTVNAGLRYNEQAIALFRPLWVYQFWQIEDKCPFWTD